jgi:hypothetical protein
LRSPKELIDDIVRKTGLSQERVLQLVQEKKQKVGGGFLSDAGATYLVAADLGVQIAPTPTSELTLSQLSVGLNEVTTVGRILSISPLQTYKKKDKTLGVYCRLVIYDKTSSTSVTLWDDKARLIDKLGLKRGDVVRIIKAYVRPDLDMRPALHLGNRGNIELVEGDEGKGGIPTIDEIAQDLNEAIKQSKVLAVKGRVASLPIETSYTRRDGQSSTLVAFRATGVTGGPTRRIVIWGKDEKSLPVGQLKVNEPFVLTNVKVKVLPHGEFELHTSSVSELIIPGGRMEVVRMRRLLRILSVGRKTETGQVDLLAVGQNREFVSIRIKDGASLSQPLEPGVAIALEKEWSDSQQLILENAEGLSVVKSYEDGLERLPPLEQFFTKISSIKINNEPVFLQAMALSKGAVQHLDTKRGERVSKGELIVGDDTGEIMLTAWRNQADMFNGIVPGEKIWVLAFTPRKAYTGLVLEAKGYSSIVQLRFGTQAS